MIDNSKEAVEKRRSAWLGRLQRELDRILALLKTRPDVEQVILAGSLARGGAGARSDIDLVIVQRTDRSFLDRLGDFYAYLRPSVETDLLVYTPDEWERMPAARGFSGKVRREGKVLYDARHP